MSTEIINGSRTSFGPRAVETKVPYAVHTAGVRKQLVVPVVHDALPSHVTGDVTGASLPANAIVTSIIPTAAKEAYVGDTDGYKIHLVTDAGVDTTTLVTAATPAQLNAGAALTLAATKVGATGPLYVTITPVDAALTAGEGFLVIEYIEQII